MPAEGVPVRLGAGHMQMGDAVHIAYISSAVDDRIRKQDEELR
jgi:hypothetical protein